ncbi:cyclophane-forming radical SAM peptide maturase AmcB [Streptacidiphilus melanogenes]|uniref:cyclophane-forming radical SAM peptide maturase AmcB n=1 Tax=Streptacidiphilus melanogenes TaxID=411235 RepID=UPI0005AB49B2|nr:cyclophane-forming radical SAM peptide maturase AmcB [Streptacidiphilus melanogenes]
MTKATLPRFDRRISRRPRTWVAQCGSWCDLNCDYCYLADRLKKNRMSPAIAAALAASATDLTADGQPIELVWHAGEPLGIGIARFTELVKPFEQLREQGLVHHSVQTNATLITGAWCDFLTAHGFTIGVSIDGPAPLNTHRVDWHGKPSFDRTMRGITKLREQGIPFSVIAVVTADSVDHPGEILDFLASLGPTSIGLNIEETEGINTTRPTPTLAQARRFWQATIAWGRRHPETRIRETSRLGADLRQLREHPDAPAALIDPIPTITWDGDVTLLSPELAGVTAPAYGDFKAGNILDQTMQQILDGAHQLTYVTEFLNALDTCEATCQFWRFCHGAQAANRFFEHGRLDVAETNYCRTTKQALLHALSATVRKETSTCN